MLSKILKTNKNRNNSNSSEYAEAMKYNNIDTPDNIERLLSFHENNDDCYYNNGRVIFGTDIDQNEQLIADGKWNFHSKLSHYKAACIEDFVDFDSGKSATFNLVKSFCVESTFTICADPHDGSAFSMIECNHQDQDQDQDQNTDTDTDTDNEDSEEAVRPPVFISHHGSVFLEIVYQWKHADWPKPKKDFGLKNKNQ